MQHTKYALRFAMVLLLFVGMSSVESFQGGGTMIASSVFSKKLPVADVRDLKVWANANKTDLNGYCNKQSRVTDYDTRMQTLGLDRSHCFMKCAPEWKQPLEAHHPKFRMENGVFKYKGMGGEWKPFDRNRTTKNDVCLGF